MATQAGNGTGGFNQGRDDYADTQDMGTPKDGRKRQIPAIKIIGKLKGLKKKKGSKNVDV